MRRVGFCVLLSVLAAGSAPVAFAGTEWSGFYLGASAGGAWATADEFYPFGAGGTPITIDADGGVLGVHAGYQQQWDSIVAGVEVSYSDTSVEGQGSVDPSFVSCRSGVVVCRITDVEDLTMVGARLGFASERWLFALSGGYAGAEVSGDAIIVATGASDYGDSVWHDGWYIGGGVDYAMTPTWVLGLEYIHTDLGEQRHAQAFVAGNRRDVDFEMDSVRVRLSYNFGG